MTNTPLESDNHTPIISGCKLKAGLYIIATPIGNLGDITLRALDVLKSADVVMCEDTRVTHKLLSYYGLKAKMYAYNDHNASHIRPKVMDLLIQGKAVALVSDAGTPLISDPGYKLVQDVVEAGYYVTTLPGASSVLGALTLAGLPTNRFLFEGFLPPKQKARSNILHKLATVDATLVFLERASRVPELISELLVVLGDRPAAIVREITKLYEQTVRHNLAELVVYYNENEAPRGEVVIVVSPPLVLDVEEKDMDGMLEKLLAEMHVKEAVAIVAEQLDLPKKQVYARALELKK